MRLTLRNETIEITVRWFRGGELHKNYNSLSKSLDWIIVLRDRTGTDRFDGFGYSWAMTSFVL